MSGAARRAPALVAVLTLLVGGLVADRLLDRERRQRVGTVGVDPMPGAAPATALSSTWYCAGGSGRPDSPFASTIVIANPTQEAVRGTVRLVPDEGEPREVPVEVKALGSAAVRVADLVPAANVAAFVELDRGRVVVEHVVAGPAGTSAAPCASAASDRWYFAGGATAKDATLLLSLFNPFPEDAIVDLSFATDEGRAVPADFQGIVVPPGRVVVTDIGAHVRRREAVATEVRARSGRLVADQLLVRTEPGKAGVSLRLGARAPGDVWYFPDGYVADGISEQYTVFNPNDREALVDVEVYLDEGAAEPFELTVPPYGTAAVVVGNEERLPKGVGRAAVVRVVNRVPVVAERSVVAVPPAPRSGRTDVVGARRPAKEWLFAAGAATPTTDEWLVLFNPGRRATTVDVIGLADGQPLAVEGLQGLSIPAGRRLPIRVGDHVQREVLPLLVRSQLPIVAERSLYTVGGPGIAVAVGIPLD